MVIPYACALNRFINISGDVVIGRTESPESLAPN